MFLILHDINKDVDAIYNMDMIVKMEPHIKGTMLTKVDGSVDVVSNNIKTIWDALNSPYVSTLLHPVPTKDSAPHEVAKESITKTEEKLNAPKVPVKATTPMVKSKPPVTKKEEVKPVAPVVPRGTTSSALG